MIDMTTLAATIAQAVAAALQQGQPAQSQPLAQPANGSAKPAQTQAERLASKDKSLLSTFTRKGFKDVQLMDRTDPSKPFNVRPFKGWLDQGRLVRKGEHGVRGLFHVSQTDPVKAAPANPKPGPKVKVKKPAKTTA
jgi:hypothetical protein